LPRCQRPPRCARAPSMWAPLAYPVPPPRLRKLLKRLRAMGGTLAPASVPPYGKCGTVRWYLENMLQPNRVKCGGLGCVFYTFYYLTILLEWSPGSSERARAPREPRRGQRSAISGTLVLASVPGPTSVRTRPWHVGAPGLSRPPSSTLKKADKMIKSYGWYSGRCLGATVRQVWNS
jgi:hypothetical protein